MAFDLKKEKITELRTHQAVVFSGGQETWFTSKELAGARGRKRVDFQVIPELQSVLVHNHEDKALVPMVNVAYIKLETDKSIEKDEKKAKEASKPKTNLKSHEIKRPK